MSFGAKLGRIATHTIIVLGSLAQGFLSANAVENERARHSEETGGVPPAPWVHLGPLRIRDLTPFGLLRMDFLPAHAVTAPPRTWALELNLSYQNTYVLSRNVADYLRARGGGNRVHLGPEDVPAILAIGDEAYIVDGELGVFDLTGHYRFSPHWGGYFTVPAFIFRKGFLDSTIEGFHNLVGVGTGDRELTDRNQFFVLRKTKGGTVTFTSPPDDGLGDPAIGVRYSVVPVPRRWNVIVETAVKPAFRDARAYVASGETDYGLQVSLQGFFERQALYLTTSLVSYGGTDLQGISDQRMRVPTGIFAWEFKMSRHVNGILQFYASPSVIRDTDLEELKANKYLTSLGIQAESHNWVYRFALTENLFTFENTADIAVTLSIAKVFPPARR